MNTIKIITKPPNRAFQIRTITKTTAEQEKALRDQLHEEIENKTKACSNPTFDCSLPRVDGFDYCIRHILLDPKAPYKQCTYLYSSNARKCTQPAPKTDGKKEIGLTNYCFEHSRLVQLTKARNSAGKFKESETTESHLNNLSHHIKIDKGIKPEYDFDKETDLSNLTVDPFVDIDCASINDRGKKILEYASDSSSDYEMSTVGNSWKGYDMENSDNESVDSQNEDLLKHAGIYTTEEATMITKEKLIRLQALYIEQFQRLQHVLKERRRKYLHGLRRERETFCSISNQPKETPKERRLYEKLKALNQYHKKNGEEAILHKKYIEKRAKVTSGLLNKPSFQQRCMFSEGGVKCSEKSLPCCRFCKKHILEDKKQILFRACGVEKSGVTCQEPVASIFDDQTCYLHITLPPQRSYTQKKYESETEDEETVQTQTPPNLSLITQNESRILSEKSPINIKLEPSKVVPLEIMNPSSIHNTHNTSPLVSPKSELKHEFDSEVDDSNRDELKSDKMDQIDDLQQDQMDVDKGLPIVNESMINKDDEFSKVENAVLSDSTTLTAEEDDNPEKMETSIEEPSAEVQPQSVDCESNTK